MTYKQIIDNLIFESQEQDTSEFRDYIKDKINEAQDIAEQYGAFTFLEEEHMTSTIANQMEYDLSSLSYYAIKGVNVKNSGGDDNWLVEISREELNKYIEGAGDDSVEKPDYYCVYDDTLFIYPPYNQNGTDNLIILPWLALSDLSSDSDISKVASDILGLYAKAAILEYQDKDVLAARKMEGFYQRLRMFLASDSRRKGTRFVRSPYGGVQ